MVDFLTRAITTKLKFIPIAMIVVLIIWSAVQTKILTPIAESAMLGIEIGINYSRAAFKYDPDANIDLRRLGEVIPVNIPIKGKPEYFPMLPACAYDGTMAEGTRCWDEDEDNPQGAFNNVEVMAAIEKTEDWMHTHPNIGFIGSYIQFLKIVNMLMITSEGQGPNLKYFHVPNAKFFSKNMDVYGDVNDKGWVPNANEIVTSFNGLLDQGDYLLPKIGMKV